MNVETDNSINTTTLVGLLRSDLERFFFYNGQPGRVPRKRDLWRNFTIPRCLPVALYRVARALQLARHPTLAKLVTWINFYLHSVEISPRCAIGPYFFMPHVAGTVIGATAIGEYAVIYHQVTLGAKTVVHLDEGRPVVGNQVIGAITIDHDCQIGANSVVLSSVPAGSLAVGIPAKVVSRTPRSS